MPAVEQYLKPEVIRQISRLDLRAQFIVKGFLQGLHASPFHGFSVEFSEHRKYTPGDDPKDIDWLVYAKTDRYYVKKYQAETNITGYLLLDLSESMGYTYRQELTKFDYAVCLAAALGYLMVHQQDPIGLLTFDEKIQSSLPPRSKRTQLGNILAVLSRAKPSGGTEIARSSFEQAHVSQHLLRRLWRGDDRQYLAPAAARAGPNVSPEGALLEGGPIQPRPLGPVRVLRLGTQRC